MAHVAQSEGCSLLVDGEYSGYSVILSLYCAQFNCIHFCDGIFCKLLSLLYLGHSHQYMVESNDHESGKSNGHRCVLYSSLFPISPCNE